MKTLSFSCLMLLFASSIFAQQSADEKAIRDVIARLFEGMQKGDSAKVHSAFTKEVSLITVFRDKKDVAHLVREGSLDEFLKAVGTPHKEIWYEETWGLVIQIDGDFAQAWCDYGFYFDNTFSHCGVDAFQLFKSSEGWKIAHLADTRRKQNCDIPKDIAAKHTAK